VPVQLPSPLKLRVPELPPLMLVPPLDTNLISIFPLLLLALILFFLYDFSTEFVADPLLVPPVSESSPSLMVPSRRPLSLLSPRFFHEFCGRATISSPADVPSPLSTHLLWRRQKFRSYCFIYRYAPAARGFKNMRSFACLPRPPLNIRSFLSTRSFSTNSNFPTPLLFYVRGRVALLPFPFFQTRVG